MTRADRFRIALALTAVLGASVACKPDEPQLPPAAVQLPPAVPQLSPIEREAKNRGECHVIAVSQSQFDPTLADEPVRTISETHKAGGDVVGSGAVAKGAVKGAVGGVVVGAIAGDAGKGAAIGAGAGALIGGVRRRQETQKMVTTTRTNPAYTEYVARKDAYRSSFDACMSARNAPPTAN
jgi:hypothetical protein